MYLCDLRNYCYFLLRAVLACVGGGGCAGVYVFWMCACGVCEGVALLVCVGVCVNVCVCGCVYAFVCVFLRVVILCACGAFKTSDMKVC
jgi:hypothetical protein